MFFRVSIAIEPSHSLLTVRYHELLQTLYVTKHKEFFFSKAVKITAAIILQNIIRFYVCYYQHLEDYYL